MAERVVVGLVCPMEGCVGRREGLSALADSPSRAENSSFVEMVGSDRSYDSRIVSSQRSIR